MIYESASLAEICHNKSCLWKFFISLLHTHTHMLCSRSSRIYATMCLSMLLHILPKKLSTQKREREWAERIDWKRRSNLFPIFLTMWEDYERGEKTLTLQRASIKFPPLNCLLSYASFLKRFIIGCAYVNDNMMMSETTSRWFLLFYHRHHLIPFLSSSTNFKFSIQHGDTRKGLCGIF